jgi:hypothetical protein
MPGKRPPGVPEDAVLDLHVPGTPCEPGFDELDVELRAKGLEGAADYRIRLLFVVEGMHAAIGLAERVQEDTGITVLTPEEDETLCKGFDLVERMSYVVAAHALGTLVPFKAADVNQLRLPAEE